MSQPVVGGRRWLWIGLLLTLLAFGLRLHHLGGDSFWIDEMATVRVAQSWTGALGGERDHPPLTYLFTRAALLAAGESEFAARFPSLLAATLTIPVLLLWGRLLARPGAGQWSAFLLALSPFHLKYAQEARHYAWLGLFSLLSFALLYLALTRPGRWRWPAFALVTLLNLYTHFGAILVLGAQGLLIGGWLVAASWQAWRAGARWRPLWPRWRGPLLAGLLIGLLFLPWLARLAGALPYNVGAATLTDTGVVTPLVEWGRNIYLAFGAGSPLLAPLFLLLCPAGLLWLAGQRDWPALALLLTALGGPLLLLFGFQVARGPFPRYVISLLPFYLLAGGIALDAALSGLRRRSVTAQRLAGGALALVLLLLSGPRLQAEYRFVVGDWRGIVQQLGPPPQTVLALSLNGANGYNISSDSLPYYLAQRGGADTLLAGNALSPVAAQALAGQPGGLWGVVHDWRPADPLAGSGFAARFFPAALYVVAPAGEGTTALDQAVGLYEWLVPRAEAPVPQCLLQQDLAALYVAQGAALAAGQTLAVALAQCPAGRADVREAVTGALVAALDGAAAPGEEQALAGQLLALDPNHPAGLAALTVVDLLAAYAAGQAALLGSSPAEPVRLLPFTMPGGAPEETLLLHPPAGVAYDLALPAEPVQLYFRAALAPQSWGWGGDGATFIVAVQVGDAPARELYRQHVGNQPADHTWHPLRVSLADYAGQRVRLIVRTEAGPAGDSTGDWAGLASPRLLWELPQQAEEAAGE